MDAASFFAPPAGFGVLTAFDTAGVTARVLAVFAGTTIEKAASINKRNTIPRVGINLCVDLDIVLVVSIQKARKMIGRFQVQSDRNKDWWISVWKPENNNAVLIYKLEKRDCEKPSERINNPAPKGFVSCRTGCRQPLI
jgi:hypothetical protein